MTFRQIDRHETVEQYARLWSLEYPESPNTVNEVAVGFNHIKEGAFEESWALEVDGEVVGLVPVGDFRGGSPTEPVEADILMHPDFEHLYEKGMERFEETCARSSAAKWCVWTHNRSADRIKVLEGRGFEVMQTVPVSQLDIDAFDPSPLLETVRRVEANIRLASLQDLMDEGVDWLTEMHEMNWEIVQDVPSPHPPANMDIEQFRKLVENRTTHNPESIFVALDGGKMVGYSRVSPSLAREDLAFTGLSGVVRSHRRRGIVTALKVYGIEAMRDQGIRWLQTDNDETNPMFQLNLRLGFKPLWKWLQYVKEIS